MRATFGPSRLPFYAAIIFISMSRFHYFGVMDTVLPIARRYDIHYRTEALFSPFFSFFTSESMAVYRVTHVYTAVVGIWI